MPCSMPCPDAASSPVYGRSAPSRRPVRAGGSSVSRHPSVPAARGNESNAPSVTRRRERSLFWCLLLEVSTVGLDLGLPPLIGRDLFELFGAVVHRFLGRLFPLRDEFQFCLERISVTERTRDTDVDDAVRVIRRVQNRLRVLLG